jgi:hypothetical protein
VEKGQDPSDTSLKIPGLLLQIRSDYNTVNAVGRIMMAQHSKRRLASATGCPEIYVTDLARGFI